MAERTDIVFTEEELKTIFTSSCIESAARAIGCSPREIYARMKRVDMIRNYIWEFYDVLHTQSREYVTEDVLKTLEIWEKKKDMNQQRKEGTC